MKYILFLLLLSPLLAFSQVEPVKEDSAQQIQIIHADHLNPISGPTGKVVGHRLRGHVIIKQDSTLIHCDSMYFYSEKNRARAFSNVWLEMSDSLDMYCEELDYEGNTRIAEAYRNIRLISPGSRLETPRMTFFRNEEYGLYKNGGVIFNGSDTMSSQKGYYYPKENKAYFKGDVVMRNPDYHLSTDTLGYDTHLKRAIFMTETRIVNEEGTLITEDGYYDTETKKIILNKGSSIQNKDYNIKADNIDYAGGANEGIAEGNVVIVSSDSSMHIEGERARFFKKKKESFMTKDAVAMNYMEDDTLYITADTLHSLTDTLDNRLFRAWNQVYIFSNNMQAKADSMIYRYADSVIVLFGNPVLWADKSQITADTILLYMSKGKADSMSLRKNCFVVSQEDSLVFNQIKGRNMAAKFIKNKLRYLHVVGNSESIYFAKDDKKDIFVGKNFSSSQELRIILEDSKVVRVKSYRDVQAEVTPYWKVVFTPNILEGMKWRANERPDKPKSGKDFARKYSRAEGKDLN